ncbi:MAG: 7-carboxy-7-deazaguanine synthase QueE, partial [Thermoplasmata archaeon]
ITEIFHSLQGEGIKIGLPTTFVRTSGCNLRCEWCDTRYAWEGGEEMEVSDILEKIDEIGCSRVCVTGGEPLLQDDILSLIDQLLENYEISVETNGSIDLYKLVERDLMVSMDYKTPSSKMEKEMRDENLKLLRKNDQLKFVISDEEDYEFSKDILKKFDPRCEVIFQTEESFDIRQLAGSVLEDDLDVRVLPQLHKMIWNDKECV